MQIFAIGSRIVSKEQEVQVEEDMEQVMQVSLQGEQPPLMFTNYVESGQEFTQTSSSFRVKKSLQIQFLFSGPLQYLHEESHSIRRCL
jgi:hypothetical protein